jgi:SAM-dependent methyltransferase
MSRKTGRQFAVEEVTFDGAAGLEFLRRRPDRVVVASDPVGDAPLPPDHVMGASGASRTLLTLTPRMHVGTALDLGAGCGVGSVALAEHAGLVVAADLSERALSATSVTCQASAVDPARVVSVRGSFTDAFAADSFDLVTSNPPFVIGPQRRHEYRDSAAPGDSLTPMLLAQVRRVLRIGGWAVLVTSWLHTDAEPWTERVCQWFPSDCVVWAAQRDVLAKAEYVDFWLRDSRESGSTRLRDDWLGHLDSLGATAVGFGWLVLHRPGVAGHPPVHWTEDVSGANRVPTGAEVMAEVTRRWAVPDAVDLLSHDIVVADDVQVMDVSGDKLSGWAASEGAVMLVPQGGWRAPEPLDPALSWLLLADRGIALQRRLNDCADALDIDIDDVLVSWLPGVRGLIERGFVTLDLG